MENRVRVYIAFLAAGPRGVYDLRYADSGGVVFSVSKPRLETIAQEARRPEGTQGAKLVTEERILDVSKTTVTKRGSFSELYSKVSCHWVQQAPDA